MSQDNTAKILWVQDDFNGPYNGIASFNGENLWFMKVEDPLIISSTNIPVPEVQVGEVKVGEIKSSLKSEGKEEIQSESDDDWEDPIDDETGLEERLFNLFRLSPELYEKVNNNHIEYCLKTRSPLNHGDPVKPKPKIQSVKSTPEEIEASLAPGETTVEVEHRILAQVTEYIHTITPHEITGEFVALIKQSDFSNYLVPHPVETN